MGPHRPEQKPKIRFISRVELLRKIPLSYMVIWEMMCNGEFPRSVVIGKNKVAWVESEVQEWMVNRANNARRVLKGDPPQEPRHREVLKED